MTFTGAIVGWGAATAALAAEPAPKPAGVATPAHIRAVASDARLETAAPIADRRLRLDDPDGQLRTGFGGTLVNLFPFEQSRFHLSAGGRLFARPRASRGLDERGLLATPRGSGGARAARRFAPALLVGVDETAGGGVSLGLDAGVVMGPTMDRMRGPRAMRRGGGDLRGGPNGIARVTMGYRF